MCIFSFFLNKWWCNILTSIRTNVDIFLKNCEGLTTWSVCIVAYKHEISPGLFDRNVIDETCAMDQKVTSPQPQINYHSSLMTVWSYPFKQRQEILNVLKAFSPNTMTYWIFKKESDSAVLRTWSWHYWFVNTKHQVTVFNFYLFIFLLH